MHARFADPKIETRSDVKRPFYFIRVQVPLITPAGLVRRREVIKLGFCDEMTKRNANQRKQEVMAPINGGRFIVQSQIIFSELAERFLEVRVPQLGAATRDKYTIQIRNHILPAFQHVRLCDIDHLAVEAWLASKQDYSWWARQDFRNILSAIFSKASEWKLWDGPNPCAGVKIGPKRDKRQKRIPKADDLARFLAALPTTRICSQVAARLIVLTAAIGGLRVSEVLALTPSDIQDGTVRVEKRWRRGDEAQTKSESSRRIRHIGALAGELLEFARGKKADEYIFQRDGEPLDDRDLQQHVFRKTAESVGIYYEGFGMHTFRRLNITWRQEAGATPFEAMKAAGHSKPDMTWLYTIADVDREREQVGRIYDRIREKVEGKRPLKFSPTGT